MSFWDSQIGEVTGAPESAFTKAFSGTIPDNSYALARIESALNDEYNGIKTIKLEWVITSGDFENKHVFQKLKVYDVDAKKRHTALNMLKLLFTMFHVKQLHDGPPSDQDLSQLVRKAAGIKIQEWLLAKDDGTMGSGNYVSEVHPVAGFQSSTGKHKDAAAKGVDSALTRHAHNEFSKELNDDVPF